MLRKALLAGYGLGLFGILIGLGCTGCGHPALYVLRLNLITPSRVIGEQESDRRGDFQHTPENLQPNLKECSGNVQAILPHTPYLSRCA
jgi:hypothetical protein